MQLHLSDLCSRSDKEYEILRQHTDSCAAEGKSYELRCVLPACCSPTEAALGFCRTGDQYRLYIRPRVSYSGNSDVLSTLFSPHPHAFPTFHALTTQLRFWGQAMHSTSPLAPMPPMYQKLCSLLEQQIIGQPQATKTAAYRVCTHMAKLRPIRPLSLVLHGPTGTGKTELCKTLVSTLNLLSPTEPFQFVRTDLNTYTEAHSVARLIGSPPGYIGYDDQPVLEQVLLNPRTVFLFDELEKAHCDILKIFMAILDEGRCSAHHSHKGHSQELDFRRCIFLFTTNLDLSSTGKTSIGFSLSESVPSDTVSSAHSPVEQFLHQDELARRALVSSGVLREIAGRFTGFLPFHPLDQTDRTAITAKQIRALGDEFGLRILTIAPEIVTALTPKDCFSVRSLVPILENLLSPLFSQHDLTHGNVVHLLGTPTHFELTVTQTAN